MFHGLMNNPVYEILNIYQQNPKLLVRFYTKVFVGKLCFRLLRVRSGRIQNL
jgi:hypothetical protein